MISEERLRTLALVNLPKGEYSTFVHDFARAVEAEAYEAALEEAAQVCERLITDRPPDAFADGANMRSHSCALAIRAMKKTGAD